MIGRRGNCPEMLKDPVMDIDSDDEDDDENDDPSAMDEDDNSDEDEVEECAFCNLKFSSSFLMTIHIKHCKMRLNAK